MSAPYEPYADREDEERLPEGVQRIGYDSDTQIYTFRDREDGTLWEGEPGSRFGTLHRAGVRPSAGDDEVLERARKEDWRYMAPFLLLVALVLLVVWRFFGPSIFSSSPPHESLQCAEGSEVYAIVKGDTCWRIAEQVRSSVEQLRKLNRGLDCEALRPHMQVCVPKAG